MAVRFKKALLLLLFSMGSGVLLAAYSLLPAPANLLFSFAAVIIGIFFFRKFSAVRDRILFFVFALLFFFLTIVVITTVQYVKENPIEATEARLAIQKDM
ncbi:O-antigen ligase [Paenibacillus phyllosphaerae]|uniref:O-antigen ligase n=1 Tax=Paenibacillus phyllosphaerae TaxID=274593 RepID=A0A7W5AY62_9BACL|nr:hypothetical protein [Paenibacillus phyllosphaerae]MBB3110461.1 O-antigen ligase [Paenibacillus phyllosphaerae]